MLNIFAVRWSKLSFQIDFDGKYLTKLLECMPQHVLYVQITLLFGQLSEKFDYFWWPMSRTFQAISLVFLQNSFKFEIIRNTTIQLCLEVIVDKLQWYGKISTYVFICVCVCVCTYMINEYVFKLNVQ